MYNKYYKICFLILNNYHTSYSVRPLLSYNIKCDTLIYNYEMISFLKKKYKKLINNNIACRHFIVIR